ncbi:hypothetical protein ASF53_15710 [Methylobacterium sp. Leaf123]|uniref:DUF1963 domain-containing protein n=1 Tax=Methylobacterium sp. Leaf123 TaxID=1736264 RepID=UPI0007001C58|nr:DUF1963 domain-containing protein [Methylobacterium sp. Leaf123]KQQ12101.1 hypothetical protein ASF53_15710 [Methylobacterium sp. Leaf123]
MFDTPADAQAQLAQHFLRPQVEMVVGALVPTLVFRPRTAEKGSLGGTRIGGTPDLPPGLTWPRRAKPADIEAIAKRGNAEAGEEMRRHFRKELPYAFFAQVDLGEARGQAKGLASGEGGAAALPGHGRLLFFYDLSAGPWDNGTESARVFWDDSPREGLTPQTMPADLAAAADAHRAEITKSNRQFDLPLPKPGSGTPYGGPARPMSLHATLRPPAIESLEMDAQPALKAALALRTDGEEGFRDAYQDLFSQAFDRYHGAANAGRRNQLLGSPLPEQSDPRVEAEVVSRFGVQHLERDKIETHRTEIDAGARTWRLLLQIDVGDFLQEDGEGTVYFLIRASDLAERRFDRVVAVYQQT